MYPPVGRKDSEEVGIRALVAEFIAGGKIADYRNSGGTRYLACCCSEAAEFHPHHSNHVVIVGRRAHCTVVKQKDSVRVKRWWEIWVRRIINCNGQTVVVAVVIVEVVCYKEWRADSTEGWRWLSVIDVGWHTTWRLLCQWYEQCVQQNQH